MKQTLVLKSSTKKEWVDVVLNDFPSFLQDHADCERKASAMALSFVAKYPDRKEIIGDLIATAREELEHFDQVYRIMSKRNIPLPHEIEKDHYINKLIGCARSGVMDRFLDRLILASIFECRGAERFALISEHIQDKDLQLFYHRLGVSEARHCHIFLKMALIYFEEEKVFERVEELLQKEAEIIESLPLRPALH